MGRTSKSNIVQTMEDGNYYHMEHPVGSIDGSNTTFTLSYAPNPADSLELELNGQTLDQGSDYTLSGSTITLSYAIPSGSLGARYITQTL